jgi:hypothetical protein
VRTCFLRVPARPNAASHCGHAWSLRCSCNVRTCVLRVPASPNAASHCGHAWSLRCSCTVRTCFLRLPACPNAASHCGHAWSLRCSCTVRTCVLRWFAFPKAASHCGHACLRDLSSFTILWLWLVRRSTQFCESESDARSTVAERIACQIFGSNGPAGNTVAFTRRRRCDLAIAIRIRTWKLEA